MKALLTIEEAAELTKLSIKTLYTYAEKEKIPHIKLGRRVLFDEDELEKWVRSCSIIPVENGTSEIEEEAETDAAAPSENDGVSA